MKNVVVYCGLFILMVLPVWAELGEEYRDWAEGPEGFLLTDSERTAWEAVADDQAAKEFIELFWAKRDPDLSTRENEFRTQFDLRVAHAEANFGEGESRGALTDRGRTLILLGGPKEFSHVEIGEYLARLYRTGQPPRPSSSNSDAHIQMQGVSFNVNKGKADLWAYAQDQLPVGIEWPTKSDLITFAFFDHEGTGQYRTQLGIRKSADAASVLDAVPGALVFNPDLQTVPIFSLIPGIPPASAEELAWLDSMPIVDGVVADVGRGAAGPGVHLVWLSVRLPADARAATKMVGRLSQDGDIVGSFRTEVTGLAGPLGTVYEMGVPAPEGLSVLDVALGDAAGAIFGDRFDLEFEGESGVFMTPAFAGAEVEQRPGAAVGEPFIFGGYHLAVRPDGRYLENENLSIFCLLVVPDAEEVERAGTVRMRWYVDGKPAPTQPSQPAQFSPGGSSTWVWGTQLPLGSLPREHHYELKVTLKDSESGVSSTTKLPVVFTKD